MPFFTAKLMAIFNRNIYLSLLLALCCLPACLITIKSTGLTWDEYLISLMASGASLSLILGLSFKAPKTALTILNLLSPVAVLEAFFINSYSWPIDANTLSVLIETNSAEASDFAGSIPAFLWAALSLTGLICLFAWLSKPTPIAKNKPASKIIIYSAATLVLTASIPSLMTPRSFTQLNQTSIPEIKTGQDIALRASFPFGLLPIISDFLLERLALEKTSNSIKKFHFNIEKIDNDKMKKIYILVIGESSRADHWQINGYARATNPNLSERADILSLRQLYTPWTYTRLAVPLLISRKPPSMADNRFNEASIVSVFKQEGFDTTWLSLQAPTGFHDTPISIHAHEADTVNFLNPLDYRHNGSYDDKAIKALSTILQDHTNPDKFIVIHLLGSHFRYTDRYPRSFAKFQPDDSSARHAELFHPEDKSELINGYDNSILFTDYVINSIIKIIEDQKDTESWLLYSSDHGEALFDDCRMLSGHGENSIATQHVSGLFWASRIYIEHHPARIAYLISHQETLASTSMFFETMTDLAGFKVEGNRPNNSLAAPFLRVPTEVQGAFAPPKCPAM